MRRRAHPLLGAAAVAALAACSTASDMLEGRRIDYRSAGSLPPLEVPPDLIAPARDPRFALSEAARGSATLSAYQAERGQSARTASAAVLPAAERMRIERAGTQRWLVVQEAPEKLWPVVKDFWLEHGFLVTLELPEAGVMETDWAENRAKLPQDILRATLGKLLDQVYSTSERDKFRTRFERSGDGATEIYISHRGMQEVYTTEGKDRTVWQPRPPDAELEAEFLRRLMVRLGAQEEQARQLVAQASAPVSARAALRSDAGGGARLEVFEPFDRAWRRVGLALDRVGFTVEDRDRQKGVFFVRYADPEAEMRTKDAERPGLLGRLAFWRSAPTPAKAEQYRVQVSREADHSAVTVLAHDGATGAAATARRILALLHEQLK